LSERVDRQVPRKAAVESGVPAYQPRPDEGGAGRGTKRKYLTGKARP